MVMKKNYPKGKTEAEWKAILSAEEFEILRKKGTERAFSGELTDFSSPGIYLCAGCETPLFSSQDKFHSGCGWPSFSNEIPGTVEKEEDFSFGMKRTEIICTGCGGHLGHVFDDGPPPTGLRYCVNSRAIKFSNIPE